MSNTIVILGGGVGGMTAAHELIERGFQVDVYEMKSVPGGKARSLQVPDRSGGVSLSFACAVPRPSARSDTIPTATTAMFIAFFTDCSLIG